MDKNNIGILVVISGASGAGKDSVLEGFLKDPKIQKLNLKRVVTCADRPPRPGETDGVEYHFVTQKELQEMADKGELIEPIMQTGSSGKATTKSEIERVLRGENLIWRIEPERAADVARGDFYKRVFGEIAPLLQKHTLVLSVVAPEKDIEKRRRNRDGERFDPNEYKARDAQEERFLKIMQKHATLIQNLDGKLDQAVNQAVDAILSLNNKK